MEYETDVIDTAAKALAAALMLLGIVGAGIVEILAGQPYGAAPLTNEAGEVIATPAVDPTLRTALVLAGFAVLLLWGLYKMALGREATDADAARQVVTGD